MPQLLKLRFVCLGHPQARMDDLLLNFQGPDGRATDSTLWLRNGGGKSSILNLFFAIVRPDKREFLGGKAEAKQRSLNDYVLPSDRGVAVAEWQLDPATDSLGLESERFIAGVFYERRDGSADLRRLFFSCRIASEHPESTIEQLPLFTASNGTRSRRTLGAFREAWRLLRDRAPHLNVGDTENQREWQEVLEAARIDPELFSYQVRMNQREGGADELFRFPEAEDFIDFLLALALDPALGDRVGKNITTFRRELLQRKEQLVPEQNLVGGLIARVSTLGGIHERRQGLRVQLGEVHADLGSLDALAGIRLKELGEEARRNEAARIGHATAAEDQMRQAASKLGRAAQLKKHGAELRLARLQEEHEQAQDEWRNAQRLARIWSAAVPLRRALQFEEKAKDQRRLLQEREREHAPLRTELEGAARRFAAALTWRAQGHRKRAEDARGAEKTTRDEARECRLQAVEAGKVQSQAETEAKGLEQRLEAGETKRKQLVRERFLGPEESPDGGVIRWTTKASDHQSAVEHLDGEIARLDEALKSLDDALAGAGNVLSECQLQHQTLKDRFERATRDREAIERDAVTKAALELEAIDADRIGDDAVATLEQAARAAQRSVVETRLAVADDERSALHLEEHGLLPPSADAQHVVEFLSKRLGGQAWSGWSWIQTNVPKQEARAAVRKAPSLAQGVVVRPADLKRAAELLREAGLEPEGPVLIGDTDTLTRAPDLPGVVVGPKEWGWFDREVAQVRLTELRVRLDEYRQRIHSTEAQHRDLTRAAETLRSFRARYPMSWFENTSREVQGAYQREEEARSRQHELQEERDQKTAKRKQLENERRNQERDLEAARNAVRLISALVEEYIRPGLKWHADLEVTRIRAKKAADESKQWLDLADTADNRAKDASEVAQKEAEEARPIEAERSEIEYVEGEIVAEPGPLDEFRARYRLIRGQYEGKVGADALLALAKQNDDNGRDERARLAKLLSAEITEDIVRGYIAGLAEPDTVEQLRQEAEAKTSSLQGRMGNLKGRIEPAMLSLQQAEEACKAFIMLPPLPRPPSTPELAEAEAAALDGEAKLHHNCAESEQAQANEAKENAEQVRQRAADIGRHAERLRSLRDHYADLLADGIQPAGPSLPATLEESMLPSRLKKLGDWLRKARVDWQSMDSERGTAVAALRTFAGGTEFERLDTPWVRRLQEHDDPALENASVQLGAQLELRRSVLEEQISGIDRHRTVLVDELHAVAEDGMKLLRQASGLSKLPDHVPGVGGAYFLRIQTQEPEDPSEKRARLAELIDELLDGKQDLGGVGLVQAAVRRLARPVQVRVLHPDPALDRRTVSIPEMARSSGGEQLTGAILLYCTLARVRGRARGLSRRASSVLILDNPIGRASRVRFLELQRDVARAMGVQLIYTTGVNDHEALRALPNVIRLRNERVDRNTGRRLVEYAPDEARVIEAVRIGRRENAPAAVRGSVEH
ncbi:MAG TPA: hypothetical protein VFC25_10095 [Verrucomicrobiae bacterium]|nr:hypothetical protein [Verrucomicrobiae bacterium]